MKRVEIYGKNGCVFCERAKLLCEVRGYPYVYRDTDSSATDLAAMHLRNPDAKSFPQIFIGDELIGGYDDLKMLSPSTIQHLTGE